MYLGKAWWGRFKGITLGLYGGDIIRRCSLGLYEGDRTRGALRPKIFANDHINLNIQDIRAELIVNTLMGCLVSFELFFKKKKGQPRVIGI